MVAVECDHFCVEISGYMPSISCLSLDNGLVVLLLYAHGGCWSRIFAFAVIHHPVLCTNSANKSSIMVYYIILHKSMYYAISHSPIAADMANVDLYVAKHNIRDGGS